MIGAERLLERPGLTWSIQGPNRGDRAVRQLRQVGFFRLRAAGLHGPSSALYEVFVTERRRDARVRMNAPLSFYVKGKSREHAGTCTDISVGGMSIATASAIAFGAQLDIYIVLPGSPARQRLPGIVRWARGGALGVQFQPLGALETHLITQLASAGGGSDG